MRNSEPGSGLNFNLIMPIAMLAVLLIVPFSFNALMHMLMSKKHANPVIMKLPVDSTAITIPAAVKQYESFEVTLNLETKHLAKFVNELVATASEGTGIQGIGGLVSPNMKAEIAGDDFEIDRLGPQEPLSELKGISSWHWRVTPQSSGEQELSFQLHLLTQNNAQTGTKVLDLAEAHFSVQSNMMEWIKRNGIWVIVLLSAVVAVLYGLRRYYARS
ncbi:MAG: hypothetical protein KGN35_03170 [Betaproteobacteria bacterium]|nr:hypothetical protein [Betaproteobacteria bacterium]